MLALLLYRRWVREMYKQLDCSMHANPSHTRLSFHLNPPKNEWNEAVLRKCQLLSHSSVNAFYSFSSDFFLVTLTFVLWCFWRFAHNAHAHSHGSFTTFFHTFFSCIFFYSYATHTILSVGPSSLVLFLRFVSVNLTFWFGGINMAKWTGVSPQTVKRFVFWLLCSTIIVYYLGRKKTSTN